MGEMEGKFCEKSEIRKHNKPYDSVSAFFNFYNTGFNHYFYIIFKREQRSN